MSFSTQRRKPNPLLPLVRYFQPEMDCLSEQMPLKKKKPKHSLDVALVRATDPLEDITPARGACHVQSPPRPQLLHNLWRVQPRLHRYCPKKIPKRTAGTQFCPPARCFVSTGASGTHGSQTQILADHRTNLATIKGGTGAGRFSRVVQPSQ